MRLPLLLLLLLVCACRGDPTPIQNQYVAARNECQQFAEKKIFWMINSGKADFEPKEKNTKLVDAFNECMTSKSWDMGKPRDVASPPTPPAGSPGNPNAREKPPEAAAPAPAPAPASSGSAAAEKPAPAATSAETSTTTNTTSTTTTEEHKTVLTNRGVGVGAGPTYALEEVPVRVAPASEVRPEAFAKQGLAKPDALSVVSGAPGAVKPPSPLIEVPAPQTPPFSYPPVKPDAVYDVSGSPAAPAPAPPAPSPESAVGAAPTIPVTEKPLDEGAKPPARERTLEEILENGGV